MRWRLRHMALAALACTALASCQMLAGLHERSTGSGAEAGQAWLTGGEGSDGGSGTGGRSGQAGGRTSAGGSTREPEGGQGGVHGEVNAVGGNPTDGMVAGGAARADIGGTGGTAIEAGGPSAGAAHTGGNATGGTETDGTAPRGTGAGGVTDTGGDDTGATSGDAGGHAGDTGGESGTGGITGTTGGTSSNTGGDDTGATSGDAGSHAGDTGGESGTGGTTTATAGATGDCVRGQTKGKEVAIIGESFIDMSSITSELEKNAVAAGSLQSGDHYDDNAVSGTTLANDQIPSQYRQAVKDQGLIRYVFMDGGRDDCLINNKGDAALSAAESLFKTMADDKTEKVVYFFYPDPVGANFANLKTCLDSLRPKMKAICDGLTAPKCYWLDLRDTWNRHGEYTQDGIHPTAAGSKATADAIWEVAVKNCVAQ